MENIERRTVLIIGTGRCGKSTIANKILGKDLFEVNSNESSFEIHTQERNISGKNYKITVIDTASLNSRNFCKQNILAYLERHRIEWINLVIVVIRAGRITGMDKKLIDSGLSSFSSLALQNALSLVISHCEQFNEIKRNLIIQNFKEDPHTQRIAQLMGRGIITTGIPSAEEYDETLLENLEGSIKEDVANLEDMLTKTNHRVDLNDMFRHSYLEEILKTCTIL